jgi:hypothetical protein
MRRFSMMLAVAMVVTSAAGLRAVTPESAPASAPATTPVATVRPAPDFSEPQKTMLTLAWATKAGDITAVRACYLVNEAAKESMDSVFAFTDASMKLRQAVREKFGEKAEAIFRSDGVMEDPDKLAVLLRDAKVSNYAPDKVYIQLENKAAASTLTPQPILYFRRVGNEWKVDAAALFHLDRPDSAKEIANQTVNLKAITGAFMEVTSNVKLGKFADAHEAQAALGQKVRMALVEIEEETQRAATTTTAPAKK